MVISFPVTETFYLVVSLFCDVVQHLPICIGRLFIFVFVVLSSFGSVICFLFGIATKAAMASQTSFTISIVGAQQAELFSNKCSVYSKFSFTNCYGYGFMLIFSQTWNFITML